MDDFKTVADLLYELGTMRRIRRSHSQTLLTHDDSDNIASHSYRVAMIGWHLAKYEGADPYKVVMMCLTHDMTEIRTGDQNWIHKKYVKSYEEDAFNDQIENNPFAEDLWSIHEEYETRTSPESLIAKDADRIDQILLLREYEHGGNREAPLWFAGKDGEDVSQHSASMMSTESAKKLVHEIVTTGPSDWWKGHWTSERKQ